MIILVRTVAAFLVIGPCVIGNSAIAFELAGGVEISSVDPPIFHTDGQMFQNMPGSVNVSLQAGSGVFGGLARAKVGLGYIQVKAFSSVVEGGSNGYIDSTAGGQFTDELTITPTNSALLNQAGVATFRVGVDGFVAKGEGASGVEAGVTIPFQNPVGVPVGFSLVNYSSGPFAETFEEMLEFKRNFVFGQPFTIRVNTYSRARASGGGSPDFFSFADSDLSNSLEWMGTHGVVDEVGQDVTEYVMSSASGTDYRNAILAPIDEPEVPGDYNGDGMVDAADYTVWRDLLGQSGTDLAADGTGPSGAPDGIVDQVDYQFWKDRFGDTLGGKASGSTYNSLSGSATVPEPSSAMLVVAACLIVVASRRPSRRSGQLIAGCHC